MAEAGTIRARVSGPFAWFWLAGLVFLTAVGVPMLVVAVVRGGSDAPPPWFAALWLGGILWFWFVTAVWVAHEIRLSPTGELEFRSLVRTIRADAADVRRIRQGFGGWDPNTLVFDVGDRRVRTPRHMSGLFDLVTELRRRNPSLEIDGF